MFASKYHLIIGLNVTFNFTFKNTFACFSYRYPKLKEIAVLEYPTEGENDPKKAEAKSIKAMAKAWKKLIWEQAVGKRSEAVTIFKKIWLFLAMIYSKNSPKQRNPKLSKHRVIT